MWYEIAKFEIQYRIKRPETYLFFTVLFCCSIIAFNFIFEGQNLGLVKENSPYIIAKIMAILSGAFMVITSMIMGVPVLRDFEHNMEALLFVSPITKKDYLVGRFVGSFIILIGIFSGLLWGMIVGDFMPWRTADHLLPFNFWHYLQPFLTIILPNLLYGGSIFFITGALSKKLIVVYTQGLVFFAFSILSFAIQHEGLAAMLEPFSYRAIDVIIEHWSIPELNTLTLPIEGVLLYHRLAWFGIGLIVLVKGYQTFSFSVVKEKTVFAQKTLAKRAENIYSPLSLPVSFERIPSVTLQEGWIASSIQLQKHTLFYFKSIIKEPSFWAIVGCAIGTIFINSINLGTSYGVNSYPLTYLIVEELQEMSIYFFLIILMFYTGELIWKERSVRMNGIYDALPMSDFINLAGKLIGLVLIYVVLLSVVALAGIAFQTFSGYYQYDLSIYFTGLFLQILPFLVLFTVTTFFFQVLTNSKYIGHILSLLFFILSIALRLFGFNHGLYAFGGTDLQFYSDMNGYGHFLAPYLWFKLYWLCFCILLFIITVLFTVRGEETGLKIRWKLSKQRWTSPLVQLGTATILVFVLTGIYIFYNTNILNTYYSEEEQDLFRVAYEQSLKEREYIVQPQIIAVNLQVDLYPKEQNYVVEGYYILVNKDSLAIDEIHVQKRLSNEEELEYVEFDKGVRVNQEHEQFGYFIYTLDKALQPRDSIRMSFKQTAINRGFKEDNKDTHLVHNGTFFNNDRFPSLGYNRKYELSDEEDRAAYGLAVRATKARREDIRELTNGRSGEDAGNISFEIIIGTEGDQIAIAPGTLQKKWIEKERNYFHYKMDQPMINFYSIVSARYEVLRDQWVLAADSLAKPIDLEIYFHKGHSYNLDRMMQAMKASMDYFSKEWSPYPYQQMRIMEYPRYAQFAQSFPTTVPYSEALGFVLDIQEEDIDVPFFVTTHELAHQWWGLQLVAANVQGRNMILETLAQYGALMVLKEEYGEAAVYPFLQIELERYLNGRKMEATKELPLELVENQKYIYYSKGAVNMYALQDYITEDCVNLALRRFLQDWNSVDGLLQKDRYPTTVDLLGYFKAVTPDSLQYLLTDLFETTTLFENEMIAANYTQLARDQYSINLTVATRKYRVDSLSMESAVKVNDWIDIGVYTLGLDGKKELIYLEKHEITKSTMTIELTVNRLPAFAGIDPFIKLLDKKVENNMMSVLKDN